MKKKRISALLIALVMCISWILTGCGSNDSKDSDAGDNGSNDGDAATQAPASKDYYGNDISEHMDMIMYVIGDEPAMAGDVEAKINEVL
jgi:putative aldouronate transport system substrate-binding protein